MAMAYPDRFSNIRWVRDPTRIIEPLAKSLGKIEQIRDPSSDKEPLSFLKIARHFP